MSAEKWCDACKFLSLTEKEQQKKSYNENHYCKISSRRILHREFHPRLRTPKWCKKTIERNVVSENNGNPEKSIFMQIGYGNKEKQQATPSKSP